MEHALENLGPERFQQLCQALLTTEYHGVLCLPIGQPDGGRDALAHLDEKLPNNATIFQVKYAREPPRGKDAVDWIVEAVNGELAKIERLVQRGASHYFIITNAAGTAHLDVGSIDRVQREVSALVPIPTTCWWRDDLNRRLDGKWDIKLRYPEVLSGQDFLRLLLETSAGEQQDRRRRAITTFLSAQYNEDVDVKFKQIELHNKLLDLFMDLPFRVTVRGRNSTAINVPLRVPLQIHDWMSESGRTIDSSRTDEFGEGTATLLLSELGEPALEQMVIEGGPGQGKSTLVQYLCQVHRIRWLQKGEDFQRLPKSHKLAPLRIPFKVDLRDLSAWLSGIDPFSDAESPTEVTEQKTVETFIARLVRHHSGGLSFDVNDIHEISKIAPLLVALDGLDEVADIRQRADVVSAVTKAMSRLQENCAGIRLVITSRPAAFANSPGFSPDDFPYLQLGSVRNHHIKLYAARWIEARGLSQVERSEFNTILLEKIEQPHIRELARNPMQLAILLALIHTRGAALPDKRTSLYGLDVDLFFSREAAKSANVRKHIDLLKDIHRYLAWTLHTSAELGKSRATGRISRTELRAILRQYLEREHHPTNIVDEIFGAMLERVVMLVSRIEGTYEFEVQPLREYFAARWLYDTASYSPAGHEKGGTKPDRFDAVARNPYWLNVTRFFCGCFSKGELLDLAERVKDLIDDPVLGETRHPALLAAMLLSDWVFAQTPKAVSEVATSLSRPIVLRKLLTLPNTMYEPNDAGVQIPAVCGGERLIDSAFVMAKNFVQCSDLLLTLAEFIRVNEDLNSMDRRWLDMASTIPSAYIAQWCTFGIALGSVFRLTQEELHQVLEASPYQKDVAVTLALGGRFELFLATEEDSKSLLHILFEHPFYSYQDRSDERGLFMLPHLLEHHSYWRIYGWRYQRTLVGDLVGLFAEKANPEYEARLASRPVLVREAYELSCELFKIYQIEREGGGRSRAIEMLENLVEGMLSRWGSKPGIYSLANSICYLPRGLKGRSRALELFATETRVCDRIRWAKGRGKVSGWWREQLGCIRTEADRFLFHLTLWSWCDVGVIFDLSDEIGSSLDGLSSKEWRCLLEFIEPILQGPFGEISKSEKSSKLLRKVSSSRLALLLGMKDRKLLGREAFTDHLLHSSDGSRAMAGFRQVQAFEAALGGVLEWDIATRIVKGTYAEGAVRPLSRFLQSSGGRTLLPDTVRTEVLRHPEQFPVSLWRVAERGISAALRKNVRPVMRVAQTEGWIDGESSAVTAKPRSRSGASKRLTPHKG